VHEQRVVWTLADDTYLDAVVRIPSCKPVEAVEPVTGVEIVTGSLSINGERAFIARDIDFAPPNVVLGGGTFDDAFVFRRATRFRPGVATSAPFSAMLASFSYRMACS